MNTPLSFPENDGPLLARIGEVFAEMSLPPVPSADDTLASVMAAATQVPVGNVSAASFPGPRPSAFGVCMRIATTLAAAAAIAAVFFISLRSDGGSVAFADVQKRLAEVRTAVMKIRFEHTGQPPITGVMQLKDGVGMRQVMQDASGETVLILNMIDQHELTLSPNRRAVLVDRSQAPPVAGNNPVQQLHQLDALQADLESREQVAGRDTLVYRVADDPVSARVWVDAETRLPVRSRYAVSDLEGEKTVIEVSDYAWDVPLDDDLFDLVVPEGYTTRQVKADSIQKATEADFLQVLALWAALDGKRFPEVVRAQSSGTIASRLLIQGDPVEGDTRLRRWAAEHMGVDTSTPDAWNRFLETEFSGVLSRGTIFLSTVATPRGFAWHGAGALQGDADRVICFWREVDTEDAGYRVVYGDLRVTTLPELPKLPEQSARPTPTSFDSAPLRSPYQTLLDPEPIHPAAVPPKAAFPDGGGR